MAATERIAVLISPEDKASFEAKAQRMGLSLGELLRRGAAAYEPEAGMDEISALLQSLSASHTQTVKALDEADRELAETRAYFAAKSAKVAA